MFFLILIKFYCSFIDFPFDLYTLSTNFKSSNRANQTTLFNAYNENKPCVSYFLNVGDITLRENKASGYQEDIPSLSKILENYYPDDIRILFLSNEFNETFNTAKTFKLSLIYITIYFNKVVPSN